MKTATLHRTGEPATATAQTTSAVGQDAHGSADVLHLTQITRPGIAHNEVLLRASMPLASTDTWHLMTGRPYLLRLVSGFAKPKRRVSGLDVAGTVVQAGLTVTRFSVGDEVFGFGSGSFAECAAA